MEYRLCAVCNDIRLVLSDVGLGMQSQARCAVIQMDDTKLSPELKLLTGFVSMLSIICICTSAVVYCGLYSAQGNGQFIDFLSHFHWLGDEKWLVPCSEVRFGSCLCFSDDVSVNEVDWY